eukprot:2381714-Pyramimonas_sp.AAC.1
MCIRDRFATPQECDGASGNDKYQAHDSDQTDHRSDKTLWGLLLCCNHGNQLIEVHVTSGADMEYGGVGSK